MHNPVQRKIRLGFFIAFSVIIAASFFSYLVTKNLLDNAGRLNRAIEVSRRMETIIKQLKDAESSIRGFNLTGDSSLLLPGMDERISRTEEEYNALRKITAENKIQQRNLDTLKQLLAAKYRLLVNSIRRASPQAEKQHVKEGEKAMAKVEWKIEEMMRIENAQTHEKTELLQFFSALWVPVIFISSLVAILIGIYSYITLTKEFKLQLHIESKLKSYQRDLQQNITLLNKSNQELEQFAYVASHDLQEPLRKISTFSDRLQMKYRGQLPADAAELIDRMVVAVARMRVLINDLLIFSRAGRITPESITPVDMNMLLQNVLSDLEVGLQEKNAVVNAAQLPVIEGNITNFQQLFQNLLTNAVKFAHPDRQLEITISYEILKGKELSVVKENRSDEEFCRINIEDNGIGFDQAYAERIFLIFQRLHGVSEYSGTGIGLAICKKIVDSHHGYIMAYGDPLKGASFVIILPLKQKR